MSTSGHVLSSSALLLALFVLPPAPAHVQEDQTADRFLVSVRRDPGRCEAAFMSRRLDSATET